MTEAVQIKSAQVNSNRGDSVAVNQLKAQCRDLGVELIGLSEIVNEKGELALWYREHVERLRSWIDRGDHAEMSWMETQLDKRSDPRLLLPEVRTAVTLWLGHHFPEPEHDPDEVESRGKVARYAWGRDYHNVLRRVLRRLDKWMKSIDPSVVNHGSVDTSPVLERAIAEQSGVGWIGRSTLLIHPQKGTFGSLAILLSSATFDELNDTHPNRCGSCTDCVTKCPTDAISERGIDARRCISYWTIEHRGLIPKSFRASIGHWVFGCDICQEVCPWTQKAAKTQAPPKTELWLPNYERARPKLKEWLSTQDTLLDERLKGSPLRRAFPHGLKRNAIIVLTNLEDTSAISEILTCLSHPEMSVRGTAAWSLGELALMSGEDDQIKRCQSALLKLRTLEENSAVLREIDDALLRLDPSHC